MDKTALTAPRTLETSEVEIPGVGVVKVRALTREEVVSVRNAMDTAGQVDGPRTLVIERKLLAKAMVDPEMSEADVAAWQAAAPAGELEPIVEVVQEISGMTDGSPKRAAARFRDST